MANSRPEKRPQIHQRQCLASRAKPRRQLVDQLSSTLDRVGLPADCLQLEVTEREVMRNPEGFRMFMHELHELGIKIAMDDSVPGPRRWNFCAASIQIPSNRSVIRQRPGQQPRGMALNHAISQSGGELGRPARGGGRGAGSGRDLQSLAALWPRLSIGHP